MQQISPRDLAERLRSDAPPFLLDVREPWEFHICHIDGAELVPMREVPAALGRLDREQPLVVICHHGIRSQQVALFLDYHGFTQVLNLQGGIAAWARDVDPTMHTY